MFWYPFIVFWYPIKTVEKLKKMVLKMRACARKFRLAHGFEDQKFVLLVLSYVHNSKLVKISKSKTKTLIKTYRRNDFNKSSQFEVTKLNF